MPPEPPPNDQRARSFAASLRSVFEAAAAAPRELIEAALGLVYPNVCQVCGTEPATRAEGYVGSLCRAKIEFIVPPFCSRCGVPFSGEMSGPFVCSNCRDRQFYFASAQSAVRVNATLLEIIHRYKYQHALFFEPFLAGLLIGLAKPELAGRCDLIVPVPLHPVKQRERGFNQAQRLAVCLGRATGLPVRTDLVLRVIQTPSQTQLGRRERLANMNGAFAPAAKMRLQGERVALVDDVMTTGATTDACAGALMAMGAGEVRVWTVGRETLDSANPS